MLVPTSDFGIDEEESRSDSSKSEESGETRARTDKRQSKGKRSRKDTSTWTKSSGGVNEIDSFN